MKKKYKIKGIVSVIISTILIFGIFSCCIGYSPERYTGTNNGEINNRIGNFGKIIATVIRNVGVVLAVLILMILGIKYMIGSAEEKAEYKEFAKPYLIGVIILFGASGIAQIIITLAGNL